MTTDERSLRAPRLTIGQAFLGVAVLSVAAALTLVTLASAAGFALFGALSSAACAGVAIGMLVSRAFSTRHERRAAGLAHAMDQFAKGDMNARAPETSLADVGMLSETFNDMASRVAQATRRLAHEAFHDPLTGLPNRTYFMSRLHGALEDATRGGRVAVLCLDLDRFKVINDTLGHGVGDELLSVAAVRLASTVGSAHMVARLGGDEFRSEEHTSELQSQ